MLKRILSTVLLFVIAISLLGCGSKSNVITQTVTFEPNPGTINQPVTINIISPKKELLKIIITDASNNLIEEYDNYDASGDKKPIPDYSTSIGGWRLEETFTKGIPGKWTITGTYLDFEKGTNSISGSFTMKAAITRTETVSSTDNTQKMAIAPTTKKESTATNPATPTIPANSPPADSQQPTTVLKTTNLSWYPVNVVRVEKLDGWDEIDISMMVSLDSTLIDQTLSFPIFRVGWGKSGGEGSLTTSYEDPGKKIYGSSSSQILIGGEVFDFHLKGKIPNTATDLKLILMEKQNIQSFSLQGVSQPVLSELYSGSQYKGFTVADTIISSSGESFSLSCKITNSDENQNLNLGSLRIYLYDANNRLVYRTSDFLQGGWSVAGGTATIAPLLSKQISAAYVAEKSDNVNLDSAKKWIIFYGDKYVTQGNTSSPNSTIARILPDLVVTDITYPIKDYSDNDYLNITVKASNQGQVPAGIFAITVFVDDKSIGDKKCNNLNDQESVTQTISWQVTPGNHTIKAAIDNYKQCTELDETNNEKIVDFSGPGFPDLVTSELYLENTSSTNYKLILICKNIGSSKSEESTVVLYYKGKRHDASTYVKENVEAQESRSIPGLDPGEEYSPFYIGFGFQFDSLYLKSTIDPENRVVESDENNNEITKTLTLEELR